LRQNMASLSDIFGNAKGLKGLLTDDEIGSAQGDALLQASLALMAAGGPSASPVSFGQALANAYGKGREAFKGGIESQVGNLLTAQKVNELKRQQKLQEAFTEMQAGLPAYVRSRTSGEVSPQQAISAPGMQAGPTVERASMIGQPMPRISEAKANAEYYRMQAPKFAAVDPERAQKLLEYADKLDPPFEYAANITQEVDGKPVQMMVGKRGQMQAIGSPYEASPSSVKEYQFAVKQGYPGTYQQFQIEQKKAGASTNTINLPSESERTAGFLTQRLQQGLSSLASAVGVDPNAAKPNMGSEVIARLTGSDALKNMTLPEQRQIVENAQIEILDSALTLGTGAAYTREQLDGYRKTYFPQVGDSPATIADKQKRVLNLLAAARIKSGRATPTDIGLPSGVTVEKVK
jgi:hypothetical protein